MKEIIATIDAPPAIGPYAQGVKAGDTIYVSGQLPIDPKTGRLINGTIAAQTERVLLNIRAIVEEGGASLEDVVKITIYLKDLGDFDEVNRIYKIFFPYSDDPNSLSQSLPPARSTIEVSRLPKDAELEMDAIAVVSHGYSDPDMY
ncbi:MAG: 2-iminobutanoate/2-iminopropanoate deaminase [Abditibacteriota bacterium]|nr:2-iminobutanoate/2-iminopropanoate deaminase [Abditibacteriota bacterium]